MRGGAGPELGRSFRTAESLVGLSSLGCALHVGSDKSLKCTHRRVHSFSCLPARRCRFMRGSIVLVTLLVVHVLALKTSGPAVAVEEVNARGLHETEAEEVSQDPAYVVGILATALTFIVGYYVEHNHINWLPEAAIGVLIGAFAAYICKMYHAPFERTLRFDFEFFMTFLLPPIIFEAGYNMNVRAFFGNLGPTAFFAFIGTFASTFIVGGIVWYAGQLGYCYPLGLLASLTFGSLISATDPVTVLAVFSKLGVKVDLFSMVFGESVLNDAVAIVLSRTLLSFNEPGAAVDGPAIKAAALSFVIIFVGSSLIGIFFGCLASIVYKYLGLRFHHAHINMETRCRIEPAPRAKAAPGPRCPVQPLSSSLPRPA